MGKRPVSYGGLCRLPLFHLLLIAAAGAIPYLVTLDAPFVFDDRTTIVDNPLVRNLHTFVENGVGHLPRRLLGYLTFALNYHVGGLDVTGYHAVNLVIHLVAASLVYRLCLLTFSTPSLRGSRLAPSAPCIALCAGLVFVLHPVQTQAVTYVTQRFASLAGLFYLLAVVLWVQSLLTGRDGDPTKIHRRLYGGVAALAALAAMLTKESSATLPLAAYLYGRVFFHLPRKTLLIRLSPLLAVVFVPILVWIAAVLPAGFPGPLLDTFRGGTDIGRWEYLVTQPRVILTYLRLLVYPVGQNIDYQYPVYDSLLSLPVVCGAVIIVALGIMAALLLRRASAGGDPGLRIIAFGIGWFFVTLLVESSMIPLDDPIAEHRLYLPMAGMALSVAVSAAYGAGARSGRAAAVALLVFVAMGTATWRRNILWTSPVLLWGDSVTKSHGKARPHYNLGTSLTDAGAPEAARAALERAVALQPGHADAWHNLAVAHVSLDSHQEAIAAYRRALDLDPGLWRAHNGLGVAYMNVGRIDQAIASYREAVRLAPGYAEAWNNLGAAYGVKGEADTAIRVLKEAVRLEPDNRLFRQNLHRAREMAAQAGGIAGER